MMFLFAFFYKCKHLTRNQVIPSPLRGCFLMKMQQAAKIISFNFAISVDIKYYFSSLMKDKYDGIV